jgi:hypothetical protein
VTRKHYTTMLFTSLVTLSLSLTGAGCTHVVIRDGYTLAHGPQGTDCAVAFVKDARIDEQRDSVIGVVKVKDSGFSFACGEDDAIEIFRKEACATGANIVNITRERRPDVLSSCYRADAQLIKIRDTTGVPQPIAGEPIDISEGSVEARVAGDHQRSAMITVVAVLAGVLAGTLSAMLIFR